MSSTNVGARNLGNPTSGTSTSTVTPAPLVPFMDGLSLPNFIKIINYPLLHDPILSAMPTNLPFKIPKFEGNPGEYPSNHIHSFHIWCSSSFITEDSIHFHLFQHTLTVIVAKWYVDQPHASNSTFVTLTEYFFHNSTYLFDMTLV